MLIFGGTLPKLAEFMMVLDCKVKETYINITLTGIQKDLGDTKNKIHALGIAAGMICLFGGKKNRII